VVEVSLFSVALLAAMMLGAGTDYAIFLIGRYHEGRRRSVPSIASLVDAYRGVARVIVGSALTIAVALACLSFADVDTALASMTTAVGRLSSGLQGSAAGLSEIGSAAEDMRAGMAGLQTNVTSVSGYLDPLRGFVASTPRVRRHRRRGHHRGNRLRHHDVRACRQQRAQHRSDGGDHRRRPDARHTHCAHVRAAVTGGATRSVVLVAETDTSPSRRMASYVTPQTDSRVISSHSTK
jgi:MMPL family